jgi:16S rRNA (uracil1498-N3)-methyltransferase
MAARLFVDQVLAEGDAFALPPGPARHVQVLRLQPGADVTLFNGRGGEWRATVASIGRSEVRVNVGAHDAVEREMARAVTLAVGMPANERTDTLVEKATELGAAAIVPLVCERSVLRLHGERAEKKLAHWRGVAIAACEQSGRTRLPLLAPVSALTAWLQSLPPAGADERFVLSPAGGGSLATLAGSEGRRPALLLSGPEGGLTAAEEALARWHGFAPLSLGSRVLRADTAPLAALAWFAVHDAG